MRLTNDDGTPADLKALAPEINAAAMAFSRAIYQHSTLPLRLFEAARIETALINGCLICMNSRTAENNFFGDEGGVQDNGPAPDETFYETVLARRTDGLDDREIAAIEYARGMGINPPGLATDEALWARMKELFTDAEIVELSYCIVGWFQGRVAHVLGSDAVCGMPPAAEGQFEINDLIRAGNLIKI